MTDARRLAVFAVLAALLPQGAALAQGIDCRAARTPIDRAICAAPPAPVPASAPVPVPPAILSGKAALDRVSLPAAPRMETLLRVTPPGRFALAARSNNGTALQLVDMLTGPSELSGQAGSADGRIDVLLDRGTYKLRGFAAEGATGAVTLGITDGMAGELFGPGEARLARFISAARYAGSLSAGEYRVQAMSLGRNNRLDYGLTLASEALQPGRPRRVSVPGWATFAIATDRVVGLTSFGDVPLRAVLRREDGMVVESFGDRGAHWNIGFSRLLPAGVYALELASAGPGKGTKVRIAPPPGRPAPDADENQDSDSSNTDTQSDMRSWEQDNDAPSAEDNADATPDEDAAQRMVEVTLAVVPEKTP